MISMTLIRSMRSMNLTLNPYPLTLIRRGRNGHELAAKGAADRLLDRRAGWADRRAVHSAHAGAGPRGGAGIGPGRGIGRRGVWLRRRLWADLYLGPADQPAKLAQAAWRRVPVLPGYSNAAGAAG